LWYVGFNVTDINTKTNGKTEALRLEAWEDSSREFQATERSLPATDLTLRSFRNAAEIRAINYALERAGWNRKRAAKLLSISYRSLLYKIRRHNITPASSTVSLEHGLEHS
jgi:transcriptional regulator with GAF, ATPase, and Fis domain